MTLIEALTRSDNTNQKNNRQIFREMMLMIEVVFTMMMMKIKIAHLRNMGALQHVSLHLINYCCLEINSALLQVNCCSTIIAVNY